MLVVANDELVGYIGEHALIPVNILDPSLDAGRASHHTGTGEDRIVE
jgi:hypothetical protein